MRQNTRTEAQIELAEIEEENKCNDEETRREYLALFSDRDIKQAADGYDVRTEDLRRMMDAVGAAIPHEELRDEVRESPDELRYEADEYVVGVSDFPTEVQDIISIEYDDEEAAAVIEEITGEVYHVAADAVFFREELRLAVFDAMDRLVKPNSETEAYPVGYPIVLLK